MKPELLRAAEVRYQHAAAHAERERANRNEAVRQALEAGWTHAQIAHATGLTRSRVGQIALAVGRSLDAAPDSGGVE